MVYFDNAATTAIKPREVYSEVLNIMRHMGGNAGRGGHRLSALASDKIYETRYKAAKLFNIKKPERICFTNNATTALNIGIKGILREGDEVLISSFEHNSVLRPVHSLKQKGISYRVISSDPFGNFEEVGKLFTDKTKLVVINHISNVTGNIAPIKDIGKIARSYGALFMVDASQSAGHRDIDVERDNIDILACAGHKGLFGPQGTGLIYFRDGIVPDSIIEGGTGSFSKYEFQPLEFPDRFEAGTLNAPGIGGLGKGIDFILKTGTENIEKKEKNLRNELIQGLMSVKKAEIIGCNSEKEYGSVVAFNLKGMDCVNLSEYLDKNYGIMTRAGYHCSLLAHKTIGTLDSGCLRVSFSYFNTLKEVRYFINAIDKIASL